MKRISSVLVFLLLLAAPLAPLMAQGLLNEQQQKIYYVEHRLIPQWLYGSDGAFFQALEKGDITYLKNAAAEIAGKSFAKDLKVKSIEPGKAVLLTFEKPANSPLCYYAIVAKTDEGFAYYTLEKAIDFEDTGKISTMFCGWTADGSHLNFGPRGYKDEDNFVKEFLAGPPGDAAAAFHPAK